MTDKVRKAGSGRAARKTPGRTLALQDGLGSGPQLRAIRRDGLTPDRRRLFMETLAATCNVSEAARVAGIHISSAYYHKRRNIAFAREWAQALNVGYAELKALLLRQALFGVEEEEVLLDAEGAVKSRKIKKSYPHRMAAMLLEKHAEEVEREEERMRARAERPDGPDAVERLRSALAMVRQRGTEGDGG